jgi:hypothetical protein
LDRTEDRREITEGAHRREIKRATRNADQRISRDQSRGTRTVPRHNVRGSEHIVKDIVVTTSEVVINGITNRTASSVTQHVTIGDQK